MDKPIPKEILDRIITRKLKDGETRIKGIRELDGVCSDCGRECESRTVEIRVCKDTGAYHQHQKFKCNTCKLYLNPCTGKYTCEYEEIANHFRKSKHKRR